MDKLGEKTIGLAATPENRAGQPKTHAFKAAKTHKIRDRVKLEKPESESSRAGRKLAKAVSSALTAAEPKNPDISRRIKTALTQMAGRKTSGLRSEIDSVATLRVDKVREEYHLTGRGVGVAVMDTGFNYPDYRLNGWADMTEGSPEPKDTMGHGTWCAGHLLNMAPEAELSAIKVLDEQGRLTDDAFIKGVQWAIDHKKDKNIKILSLSLGWYSNEKLLQEPDQESLKKSLPERFAEKRQYSSAPYVTRDYSPRDQAVKKAVDAGLIVVVCANNTGPQPLSLNRYADVPGVIVIGSSDKDNTLSKFSAIGPSLLGNGEVDVLAPGEKVLSLASPGSDMETTAKALDDLRKVDRRDLVEHLKKHPLPRKLIEGYELPENPEKLTSKQIDDLLALDDKSAVPGMVFASGTSGSTPQGAGVIALMLEMKPDLTAAEIKTILRASAVDLGSPREAQGGGLIDAKAALDLVRQMTTGKA